MTPVAIAALVVALAVAWVAIDDLIWGRERRVEILTRLAEGPALGRDLARGRSARYVLLGKMQDEDLVEVEADFGWRDAPYQYRITERGRSWLCQHEASERRRRR